MNELALFAGAGGGILGGHLLGWRCVCAVEIDPYCRDVLVARQNDGSLRPFPIWDDVCTFDGRPWRGRVDVVSGGFPCQDISSANPKGKGIQGDRSGLWKQMERIIREVGPYYVFVENSPMLTVRGLGVVLGDLAALGYHAQWGVLGGGAVGAIQEGQRIWIVASSADSAVLESLDVPTAIQPYSEESRRRKLTRAVSAMLSQDDYSALKRDADAVARGMDRLRAIGNGQVPAVARLAWNILSHTRPL
ncbi:MAG: DNA cytosine methyltransferase [Verrucomicrobiota bacterium JB022]|nr:DNA cytosine methyltransferase [Verrucomicrobiota bacterium JB022]